MTDASSEFHAFTLVKKWRVGSEPDQGIVGIELIDANDELHSFCFPPGLAIQIADKLAVHAELVSLAGSAGRA
jgi:hypothetical protein